ncbi:MAG: hypothetical protein PVI59_14880 [Anaerolineae bacterium]
MGNFVTTIFGPIVTYLVIALVWSTLAIGLFQLVRETLLQIRVAPRRIVRDRYAHRTS